VIMATHILKRQHRVAARGEVGALNTPLGKELRSQIVILTFKLEMLYYD